MKQFIAFLTSLVLISSVTASVSAGASTVESGLEGYDYFATSTSYYQDPVVGLVPFYQDFYVYFDTEGKATYRSCHRDYTGARVYSAVIVTIGENCDTETLISELDEPLNCIPYCDLPENQLAFAYSFPRDYTCLYSIEGVEKVELENIYNTGTLSMAVGTDEAGNRYATSTVETKPDLELTPEMFAERGITVYSVSQAPVHDNAPRVIWNVTHAFDGVSSLTAFDTEAVKIDGVLSSSCGFAYNEESGTTPAEYVLVEAPAPDPTEGEATESSTNGSLVPAEPTDAEIPTDASDPTEPITDAKAPASTEMSTESEPTEPLTYDTTVTVEPTDAPTNVPVTEPGPSGDLPQTGMPWAKTAAGLAVTLTAVGGALVLRSRKRNP